MRRTLLTLHVDAMSITMSSDMGASVWMMAAVLSILWPSVSLSLSPLKPQTEAQAKEFLAQYGYMQTDRSEGRFAALRDEDHYGSALATYQRRMGLQVTRQLDAATKAMMARPRCGVPDIEDRPSGRKRRYTIKDGSRRVTNGTMTYTIINAPPHVMHKSLVIQELRKAFDAWTAASGLKFQLVHSGAADLHLLFAQGPHHDEQDFDGVGGVLAHALYPEYGGQIHFDMAEHWTSGDDNVNDGKKLAQVAIHEIGHSLGLRHSEVRDAMMFSSYQSHVVDLRQDDRDGLREIYRDESWYREGLPSTSPPVKNPVAAPSGDHYRRQFCAAGRFDAIGRLNGDVIAFQGELYAKLDKSGIAPGYPRLIHHDWPGLRGPVDAVLARVSENQMYIFKGSRYWRYDMGPNGQVILHRRHPRPIAAGFRGAPNDIDAAFVWGANGHIYIFKGMEYYRLSENPWVDAGYPKATATWRIGVSRVDAAFEREQGRTYFFSENKYYTYNDTTHQAVRVTNESEREIRTKWLGCSTTGQRLAPVMELTRPIPDPFQAVPPPSIGHSRNVANVSATINKGQMAQLVMLAAVMMLYAR